ncbi:head-to-tail stopper [Mycobacterium phage Avocado]|nr:head-tail adaptor [Mycobacterium phage Avocado]ASR77212.1 head-to-tail stopper [Mycobacterium phage Avocado]
MDFNIPEPFTVTHWTRPITGKNAGGQVTYGDPVPRQRKVRGFDQPAATEATEAAAAGRKVTELEMADDEGDWPSNSVVELWDGRQFEVNGDVRDENLGPFGFRPGYVVPLRRVTHGPT